MTAYIISALSGWLAWALAGLAALAGVYIAGSRSARQKARQKAVERDLRATAKTYERINDADIAVGAIDAARMLRVRDPNVR